MSDSKHLETIGFENGPYTDPDYKETAERSQITKRNPLIRHAYNYKDTLNKKKNDKIKSVFYGIIVGLIISLISFVYSETRVNELYRMQIKNQSADMNNYLTTQAGMLSAIKLLAERAK